MASLESAAQFVMTLPEVVEGQRYGNRSWAVAGKVFAWERPFSKADIKRFGDQTPPGGPIVAVRTADLNDKEAILAAHPESCFSIPHFDGYAAVLIDLPNTDSDELRELLLDGWLVYAPRALAEEYLSERPTN
jgi:hypothetical protein